MDERELQRDSSVARQLEGYVTGRITRREALRRLGILGLGLPAATALIAACSGGGSGSGGGSTVSKKSRAVIGIIQEPTKLDPTADATASISTIFRDNVYEGLVRLDGGGKLVPSLAKSWDVSPEGTTITFHLQSGVKWHDGSPFSAQDVKFAWERAMNPANKPPNPHADYWKPVRSIDVVDDRTVKVTLATYSDNWLFHMAAGSACIVSSKSADSNATSPVGTGPFKFGAWNRGASLTLTRNDAYWGPAAKLKDVEFRFMGDANAMNNALKAGDIDAIGQVGGPEQLAQFKSDPGFTVVEAAPAGKVMVSVNNSAGPLANPKVRQALYAGIDRKAWIDGIVSGYGKPIGAHASPNDGEPYFQDETPINTFDVAKAKQLLAGAGVSNLTLRLAQISAFPYAVRGSDILVSQMKAIGVTVSVQPMEFARWLNTVFLSPQDYDLTIINHVEERDIGNYANPKYYWHYANSTVADQITRADAEPDKAKRNSLYGGALKQMAVDAANLWVYSPSTLAVLKHSLKGYQVQGISPSLFLGNAYFS